MHDVAYAGTGGLALALILVSRRLRRYPVTEPLVALVAGVALGRSGLGAIDLDPATQFDTLGVASETVIALSLMSVALRFPVDAVWTRRRRLTLLTVGAMAAMVVSSSLLGAAILGLPLVTAVLLGAAVAPTDPVLGANAVEGALLH